MMIRTGNISSVRSRRGITLTELLVAVAISLVFMGSVVTAYVQISRAADSAEAEVQAHVRARTAVDTIARDIRMVRTDPTLADQVFILTSNPLPYGNKLDDDQDNQVDEEFVNGLDDDGDWQIDDDNHAEINGFTERAEFVGVPDLGDFDVDEDFVFSHDELTIRIPADPLLGDPAKHVTYRIGQFEGINNVLLREEVTNPGVPGEATTIEPLIFEVVSLDILAWNANDDVTSAPTSIGRPYWQETFDASMVQFPDQVPFGAPFGTPPFEFPAAVLVSVTVNAESQPLENIPGWPIGTTPIRTHTLTTVVAVNDVIKNPAYRTFVRPRL